MSGAPAGGARTADYDFTLPPDRIAQRPAAQRDESRLMVVERATGRIAHHTFKDIETLIAPGDALVVNRSRVMRARLLGTRDSGASGEVFLLRALGDDRWEAMVNPGGKLRPGRTLHIAPGFDVDIVEMTERRTRIVRLRAEERRGGGDRTAWAHPAAAVHRARGLEADAERYQTVYSRERGSVAAPTAGLHFTPELLGAPRGARRATRGSAAARGRGHVQARGGGGSGAST